MRECRDKQTDPMGRGRRVGTTKVGAVGRRQQVPTGNSRIYLLNAFSRGGMNVQFGAGKIHASSEPIPVETARAALPALITASHDDDPRIRKFAFLTVIAIVSSFAASAAVFR